MRSRGLTSWTDAVCLALSHPPRSRGAGHRLGVPVEPSARTSVAPERGRLGRPRCRVAGQASAQIRSASSPGVRAPSSGRGPRRWRLHVWCPCVSAQRATFVSGGSGSAFLGAGAVSLLPGLTVSALGRGARARRAPALWAAGGQPGEATVLWGWHLPAAPSCHRPGGQAKSGHTLTSLSRFVTTQGVCGDRTVLEMLNFNEMPSVSDSSVLLPTASSLWFLSSGGVEGGREVLGSKVTLPLVAGTASRGERGKEC